VTFLNTFHEEEEEEGRKTKNATERSIANPKGMERGKCVHMFKVRP
jgi:hypothetical protein